MHWFKHDADASADAKLKKLLIRYGARGYGVYWYCLEQIAGSISEHNLTFELEHDAEIIAHDMGVDSTVVEEMMRFMVSIGLFEESQGRITCLKMLKRLDSSMTSNTSMRYLIQKAKNSHDDVMTRHDSVMQEEKRREEKRLEEKRVEKSIAQKFAPPTLQQVSEYCIERANSVDASRFLDFYESKGWMVGRNKMKDWKAAVRNWEKGDDNRKSKLDRQDDKLRNYAS